MSAPANPRMKWTMPGIEQQLRPLIEQFGRMPTTTELRRLGMNALAVRLTRTRGGMLGWARHFGVRQSGGSSHRAHAIEAEVASWLRERGFSVDRQATLAPFDLLVNGRVRIDVKSAKYAEYAHKNNSLVRGHVFGNLHPIPQCDLYILCGVDPENRILWRYFVPAEEARIQTLTITPTGQRYARFKEALHELERMVRESAA